MPTPPLPRFDSSAFPGTPELGKYHGLLQPFLEGVGQQLGSQRRLHVSEPFVFTVPDDWYALGASDMRNSWQLYPSNGAPEAKYRLRLRKDASGMVECYGLAYPPSVSATGIAFAWPTGYAPDSAREEIGIQRGDSQYVEVRPVSAGASVAARMATGTPGQGWVSFSGLRFPAKDRRPPEWTRQPEVACPFLPALVVVVAREVDAQRRPSGAAQSSLASWKPSAKGYTLTRCPGLAPLVQYHLTAWAVAG